MIRLSGLAGHLAQWGFAKRAGVPTGMASAAEHMRFISSLSRHAGAPASIVWSCTENGHAPS